MQLLPSIRPSLFKPRSLLPLKRNVSRDLVSPAHYNKYATSGGAFSRASAVVEDMMHEPMLQLLYGAFNDHASVKDALVLLRVWLRQRNLTYDLEGPTSFHLDCLVAHLLVSGAYCTFYGSCNVL